jgi:hypothetical protein
MASPSSTLDFEALLSRDYRPALVTRLIPREKYKRDDKKRSKQTFTVPVHQNEDRRQTEETSRLVLSLVAQTSAFNRHPLQESERVSLRKNLLHLPAPPSRASIASARALDELDSAFHEIELGDWESKILWDGGVSQKNRGNLRKTDPLALLERPRNPFLDDLKFDETTVGWKGDVRDLLEKRR